MNRMRIVLAATLLGAMASSGLAPAVADPVDLGGENTETSTDPGNPAPIKAGLWQASLSPGGQPLQFVYERTQADSTVAIGVSAVSQGESAGGVSLTAVAVTADAADATTCGNESDTGNLSMPSMPFGVELVIGTDDYGSRDAACLRSDRIVFEVGPGYSTLTDDLDLAIKVVEESPLEDPDGDLPAPPEVPPTFTAPTTGEPEAVEPGTGFEDAPVLDDGTFSGTITEGEQLFYRVQLTWGQTLAAQLDADKLPVAVTDEGGSASVDLEIYSPLRRPIGSGFEDTEPQGQVGEERLTLTAGRGPLLYRNRFDDGPTNLPGDYYVSVIAEPNSFRAEKPAEVPFTLTVQAQGEVSGEPTFVEDEGYLIGDGQRSSVASGTPRASAGDNAGWFSARRIGGLGLGVVGLVCLVLGGLRLRS